MYVLNLNFDYKSITSNTPQCRLLHGNMSLISLYTIYNNQMVITYFTLIQIYNFILYLKITIFFKNHLKYYFWPKRKKVFYF